MEMDDFFGTSGNYNVSSKCLINKDFTFQYLSAVYVVVFLAGFLGNVFGLWNSFLNWKKWTSLNVFVLNLGLADLLYIITLPFFVSYYANKGVWVFGYEFCRLARCLFHVNMYASINFLTCISVQRYLGIVHPMKTLGRFKNLRPSLYISLLLWVWVIIQVLPNLLFTNMDKNDTYCHDSVINEHLPTYTPYSMVVTVTGFFIPFLIIVGCYTRILLVLKNNRSVNPNVKRKSIKLVLIVLILFFLCFFPYYSFRNFNLFSRTWQLQGTCTKALEDLYVTYQITRGLACLNSAINPLLYLVTNENFVSQFQKLKKKSCCHRFVFLGRNQANQDTKTLDFNLKELEQVSEER